VPSLAALPSSSFTLAAVYSRSSKSAQSLADVASEQLSLGSGGLTLYADDIAGKGLDELLASDKIDAVVLALPIPLQPDIIRRVWKAGKHCLSEKPVGKDVATAEALIKEYNDTYDPKGLVWRVAEVGRITPSSKLVESGSVDTDDRPCSARTSSASRRTAGRATSFARASSVR
jgi:predicted dehydrogenase